MKIQTRSQLDAFAAQGCQIPGCTHQHGTEPVFLHAQCHISSGLEAAYELGGTLSLNCLQCKKPVVKVKVAE